MRLKPNSQIKTDMFYSPVFWSSYKKDFENWYIDIILEIGLFLKKELGFQIKNELLEIYLFVVLNRYYINHIFAVFACKGMLSSPRIIKDGSVKNFFSGEKIVNMPLPSKTKFFRFFHRHEHLFGSNKIIENSQEFVVSKKITNINLKFVKFWKMTTGLPPSPALMNYINTLTINFEEVKKTENSKTIYTNAHFIQNSPSRLLFLLISKFRGSKIIVLQPSLFHPICSYYDQHELEIRLASEYYAWQDGLIAPPRGNAGLAVKGVGSLYCCGQRERLRGDCVVMPQIPTSQFLRAQSKSFGLGKETYFETHQLAVLLKNICALCQNRESPLHIRVKSVDKKLYSKIFKEKRLPVKIVDGNINDGGKLGIYDKMYIGYMGTALAESYFLNAEVIPLFDIKFEVALKNKYTKFFKNNSLEHSFFEKTSKKADLKFFNSILAEAKK